MNGCIWIRGSAADYDDWEARGNPGWGFNDPHPWFQKVESDPLGGELHGSDGRVPVSRVPASQWTPLDRGAGCIGQGAGIRLRLRSDGGRGADTRRCPAPEEHSRRRPLQRGALLSAGARERTNLTLLPDTTIDCVGLEGPRHGRRYWRGRDDWLRTRSSWRQAPMALPPSCSDRASGHAPNWQRWAFRS